MWLRGPKSGHSRPFSARSRLKCPDFGPRAGWVAAEYLRRAGAEVESGEERNAFVHASAFRFDACRDVAEGAFLALGKLRATLRVP